MADNHTVISIINHLQSLHNPNNVAGMARFGINPHNTIGVSIPVLRALAKKIGKNHPLAEELWQSGIHEARLLASFIDDPAKVTEEQMERWVTDIDSWDICDQCMSNLFDKTPLAYTKAVEWSERQEEFTRRAGFVLMACLSVHDKKAKDSQFSSFFPLIQKAASDDRNMVKKAVNWALRQIGKRNIVLNEHAIKTAREIQATGIKSARWIASDALRELTSEKLKSRLKTRHKR